MTDPLIDIVEVEQVLGAEGLLAQKIEGFAARPQQLAMSKAVAEAIEQQSMLAVEAGTGVGKTFAYLVPALLAGHKTLVSTGTRNLQDQLFNRDLPELRELIGRDLSIALLKGRSNYVCAYRLERAQTSNESGSSYSQNDARTLRKIRDFSVRQTDGDLDAYPGGQLHPAVRAQVTSSADNCLGQECPNVDDCALLQARRNAQNADLVVINHHLFFADLAVREGGFGEVVPFCDVLLFDEAHLIPDIATQFFGDSISSNQLLNLSRDLQAENPGDIDQLDSTLRELEEATAALGGEFERTNGREEWETLIRQQSIQQRFADLLDVLYRLVERLAPHKERSKELENCFNRAEQMLTTCQGLYSPQQTASADTDHSENPDPDSSPTDNSQATVFENQTVRWLEKRGRGFTLHNDPIEISPRMVDTYEAHPRSWIFTSATLAAGQSFDLFTRRMGLNDAKTLLLDTPFDYAKQALLYLPDGLPAPNDPDHTAELVKISLPILNASRGRAFMLFTSYAALNRAKELLTGNPDFSLLIQGDLPKTQLLEEFQKLPNALLLATASFWQGVDVRGEALSCVIIDKLPFASPYEPLLKARLDAVRKAGGNPFNDLQVPGAIITLKQGAGRLIRDHNDRGLLVIGDPRIRTKGYGKAFVAALPPMRVTQKAETAVNFFDLELQARLAEQLATKPTAETETQS